jgi:hypothetical protein
MAKARRGRGQDRKKVAGAQMSKTSGSADSIRELIGRAPKRSNAGLPKPGDAALRYALAITPAKNRNWELHEVVGDLPGFDLDHTEPTLFSVTHSNQWSSTHIGEAGMAGRDATYIEDPDGGFAYVDHTDKLFFYADKDQVVPLAPPVQIRGTIHVEKGSPVDGRETKVATVQISAPAAIRLRIWFVDDAALKPFARAVLARVVGCPDRLGKSGLDVAKLEELGLPVRVESYSSTSEHASEPLVVSTVTDLQIGHARRQDFEVPPKYQDLRKVKGKSDKTGTKRHKAGSGRVSNFRSGYSDYGREQTGRRSSDYQGTGIAAVAVPFPQCLPSTFAAQIAMETDQILYDDLRFLINIVISRLSSFSGSGGTLNVDWLNQWENSPAVQHGDDGLFCLMRDPMDLSASPQHLGGAGLLDKLAETKVRAAMLDGSITSIGLSMSPALLSQVTAALGQFDSMNPLAQAQLRELYLSQLLGQFAVSYPTSTPSSTVFYGLMNVQLSDIEFALNINYSQPMTSLAVDNNAIRMHLALPSVTGAANVARWPTGLYWAVLGASGLACLFLPFLCILLPFVAAVGAFILSDYANVSVEIDNFTADSTISFQPDPNQVLRPQATFQLDGDVTVWYISYIPTGLQQLAGIVYSLVGSHTNFVINLLESQLRGSINTLLTKTLNLSFPPQFGPVPIIGISTLTDGSPNDYLYLQAGLDAAVVGVSAPYITQVASDVETPLIAGRPQSTSDTDGHPETRAYGGFVVSQNIINYYINSIWRHGAFNYALSMAETKQVALHMPQPFNLGQAILQVHLWPAVTPRTVLTPFGEYKQKTYAATFFDDVRLCLSLVDPTGASLGSTMELQFAAEAFTQFGLGAVNMSANPPKLDIIRASTTFLDLYFDLKRLRVHLIHPEVQGLETTGPFFSGLTVANLPHLQTIMLMALGYALKGRDDQFVPSPTGDPLLQQYPIPGATIDFHLKPSRGNMYAWVGITGTPIEINLLGNNLTYYGLLALFPGGQLDISNPNFRCWVGTALRSLPI